MSELSILIVTWNSRATIRDCLNSIQNTCQKLDYEVLVWDNVSTDETVRIIQTEFPDVQLFRSQKNLGFAEGNNRLIEKTNSDYILFLNPDTVIIDNSVIKMLEYLKSSSSVAALGPKLLYSDSTFQLSYAKFPNLGSEFFTKIYQRSVNQRRSLVLTFLENTSAEAKEVDWVSGACMLTRKKVLQEAGKFDENFFLYFEDTDLCHRMKAKGKIIYFPEAQVMHVVGSSTKSQNLKTEYHYRRSQLYYYRLHNSRFSNLILKLYLSFRFGLGCIFSNKEKKEWYKDIFGLIWS
ncbi:MAG TPA: glycosyltransferase family 2 protein [candidate division Zixibacteria bacterium]|nr:glycosyltransferase family 2 protein [candidate division Zixibacteria bacterium]